ncbi:hypothetical protein OSTOST_25602 [Ostertagia ostertagi]
MHILLGMDLQYTMLESSTSDTQQRRAFSCDSSLYLVHHFPWMQRKTLLRRYVIRRRRNKPKRTAVSCTVFSSLTANEHVCTISKNTTTKCTLNQATMIALQPLQQETCLQISDHKKLSHLGKCFPFSLRDVQYHCHKRIEFFSRDHELISESHHSCYLAGSCTKKFCDNVKPTDTLIRNNSFLWMLTCGVACVLRR